MKFLSLVCVLWLGGSAYGDDTTTTVNCATTDGHFSGVQNFNTSDTTFAPEVLKNILLGQRQVKEASMPYPSQIVVSPRVVDLQDIDVKALSAFPGFQKAVYFTLISSNFNDLFVFCTISQLHTHSRGI